MTHRQFRAWQAWLADDLNRPSRADHYAMQTTAAICNFGKGLGVFQNGVADVKELVIPFGKAAVVLPNPDDDGEGPPIVTREMIEKFERQRIKVDMRMRFSRGN